jgi:hypothetical protein
LLALLFATMSVPAAPPAETVGALLLRLQEESAAPFVDYCVAKVPALKRPLEREYARFKKRFRKATSPLRSGAGAQDELGKPATPEIRAQFEAMRSEDMAQAIARDPFVFCTTLKANLSSATAESMERNMESAYSQYRAAVRQGR